VRVSDKLKGMLTKISNASGIAITTITKNSHLIWNMLEELGARQK